MVEPPRIKDPARLKPELAYKVGKIEATMLYAATPVRIIETARTIARQKWLWDSGRERPGPVVTNAKPGQSRHTPDVDGLASACDFCFSGDEPFSMDHPWELLGKLAEDLGLVWGGRFLRLRDLGHVELPKGDHGTTQT